MKRGNRSTHPDFWPLHVLATKLFLEWHAPVISREIAELQPQLDSLRVEIDAGSVTSERREEIFVELRRIWQRASQVSLRNQVNELRAKLNNRFR